MVFEEIERLQREYTDKYVMVSVPRPELARFGDAVGIVKTVNFNGRALVEFLDYHQNIGWFDIGLDYLKIVPKPDPNAKKAEKAAAKANPPAESKSPAKEEKAFKPAGGKASTADILAAARAKAGAAPAAKAIAPAKPAGGKLSTADILASARAKAAGAATAAPGAVPETVAAVEVKAVAAPAAKKPTVKAAAGPLPTTTAEKIEWCRRTDAKE